MNDPNRSSKAVVRLPTAEERDAAVRVLSQAFAQDAIAVDEFERRVADVYAAQTSKALVSVTKDLATRPDAPSDVPVPMEASGALTRRPSRQMTSVLSSIERKIQGPMPECLEVRSVMGSLELDLRRAQFPNGVTEIRMQAVMANIEIELPEHVHVEDEGQAFLSSFSIRGRSGRRDHERSTVVRITGRSVLSNVEVEVDD